MTHKYNNVYIENTSTVVGPYEKKGPLRDYFDKLYDDLYIGQKTWEKAEIKLHQESIDILLKKSKLKPENIDLIISGDLSNQIAISCYGASKFNIPFLGIYTACATTVEGMIIASTFIESNNYKNIIVSTSSHNLTSERQFRNPTEYGAPKPKTATFTATGGASILLTNKKTSIKVESTTLGKILDYNQKDALNMGANMAIAAADTIYNHLTDLKRDATYYDLILTGDLGIYGKQILIEYMNRKYNIDLSKNHNDCGILLYDLKNQKEVLAGGSGPVCSALVNYSMIMEKLRKKELKRVLLVATGALFSPTTLFQRKNILSIANAISLEAI